MANLKVTVELPAASAMPKDNVVNDFYFVTTGAPTSGDTTAIATALEAFYNDIHSPATNPIAYYLSQILSRTLIPTIRFYDVTGHLAGTPSGSPFLTVFWSAALAAAAGGSTPMPGEVAVALTYKALYGSDPEFGPGHSRPRGQDRGRLYIGPPNNLGVTSSGFSDARPSPNFITALQYAAIALMALSTPDWSQWSRVGAKMDPVVGGWIDNAFDTQRRRGQAATNRTTFGVLT